MGGQVRAVSRGIVLPKWESPVPNSPEMTLLLTCRGGGAECSKQIIETSLRQVTTDTRVGGGDGYIQNRLRKTAPVHQAGNVVYIHGTGIVVSGCIWSRVWGKAFAEECVAMNNSLQLCACSQESSVRRRIIDNFRKLYGMKLLENW